MPSARAFFKNHRVPYVTVGVPGHVDEVYGNLRKADYEEVYAATGRDPNEALYEAWHRSFYRWAIIWQGETIGLFGVGAATLMGYTGVPWLLGTNKMEEIKFTFVKQSISWVKHMLTLYPVLENWVDARNKLSIKWLKWLGFSVSKRPAPYGYEQRPFYFFEKRRDRAYV